MLCVSLSCDVLTCTCWQDSKACELHTVHVCGHNFGISAWLDEALSALQKIMGWMGLVDG